MNETVLVYGIVLGAAIALVWRFLPGSLKAKIAPSGGSCASDKGCGSGKCDGGGCH